MLDGMIRIVNLWKRYDQDGDEGSAALAGANVEIASGEVIALFGKSGSGKTTLLNILAGLDRPTSGIVEIDGQNIELLGEEGLTILRRRRLGFVFQFFNLLPTLTALENVYLALELIGSNNKNRAREVLAAVGLAGKENRFPSELSGGEQQRVAVARAIVKRPSIILADEPTGNLDNRTGSQILGLLYRQCRASGATLIMASHSAATGEYADRILTMTDGLISERASSARA
jgi:putative ABC transport system ATP-binding protein